MKTAKINSAGVTQKSRGLMFMVIELNKGRQEMSESESTNRVIVIECGQRINCWLPLLKLKNKKTLTVNCFTEMEYVTRCLRGRRDSEQVEDKVAQWFIDLQCRQYQDGLKKKQQRIIMLIKF